MSRSPVLTALGGTNAFRRKPPEELDGTLLPEGFGRQNDAPPGAAPPVLKSQAGKRSIEPHPLDSFPKNKSRKELAEPETPSEEQLKEAASMLAKMGDEMDQRMKENLKVCSFRIQVYFCGQPNEILKIWPFLKIHDKKASVNPLSANPMGMALKGFNTVAKWSLFVIVAEGALVLFS